MLDNGRPPGADGCDLPKYGGMVEVRVCLIAKCVCLVGVYIARPENWNMPRPEHHDFMW